MPTNRSPSPENATTEGVVLAPSEFSSTCIRQNNSQGAASHQLKVAAEHVSPSLTKGRLDSSLSTLRKRGRDGLLIPLIIPPSSPMPSPSGLLTSRPIKNPEALTVSKPQATVHLKRSLFSKRWGGDGESPHRDCPCGITEILPNIERQKTNKPRRLPILPGGIPDEHYFNE
ncbi:hypothetical protein L345_03444, partial [Ophiophagus hannah]